MPPLIMILEFIAYMTCFQSDKRPPRNQYEVNIDGKYSRAISEDDWYRFSALGNDLEAIDTSLEAVLALYYSPDVVAIQPAEAARLLPQNDRTSGLRLAHAVLRELTDVKFFNPQDTAAIGRYEGMIKFIQDKHGLSRAEIDNYYRDALRAEIMPIIRTAFSKTYFSINNRTANRGYYVWLSCDENGQYTMTYDGSDSQKTITDTYSAPTLDGLVAAMNRSNNFDQDSIAQFKEYFAELPIVYYAERKAKGDADASELIAEAITNFYVNPSQDNQNTLTGIAARLFNGSIDFARRAYNEILTKTWDELYNRVSDQLTENNGRNINSLARYPADPRFAVFGGR